VKEKAGGQTVSSGKGLVIETVLQEFAENVGTRQRQRIASQCDTLERG
jgi:hypothetical protein